MIQRLDRFILCLTIVGISVSAVACRTQTSPKKTTVKSEESSHEDSERTQEVFERYFSSAVASKEQRYTTARDAILREIDAQRPYVVANTKSGDWHRSSVAAIVQGYDQHPSLYEEASSILVEEGLPPSKNVTGRYTVDVLGQKLAALGADIDPWLFERAYKVLAAHTERERSVLSVAIRERRPAFMVPALLELAMDEDESRIHREFAVSLVVRLGDSSAKLEIKKILDDPREAEALRSSAGLSLSSQPEAPPGLRESLESGLMARDTRPEFRVAMARSLDHLGDSRAVSSLHRALDGALDPQLVSTLCLALSRLGDASSVETMRSAIARVKDRTTIRVCEEMLVDLRERLGAHP